jgi:GNAT superfamily N-acetyltransferase
VTDFKDSLSLRRATSGDDDFILKLYKSSRGDDLRELGWEESRIDEFLTMQYEAHRTFEAGDYPDASDEVIIFEHRPVGRLLVDRREAEIRIADLALLPEYRNRGLGSFLIRNLQKEARTAGRPLRLQVITFSPAINFLERLGFERTSETGSHFQLEWNPR